MERRVWGTPGRLGLGSGDTAKGEVPTTIVLHLRTKDILKENSGQITHRVKGSLKMFINPMQERGYRDSIIRHSSGTVEVQ